MNGRSRREALGTLAAAAVGVAARDNPSETRAEPGEVLIKGGLVAGPDRSRPADVRIIGDAIAEVAPRLSPGPGARLIDAAGKLILPGGFDPHTHMAPPFADDLTSGSMAAIAGGITTIGTFAYTQKQPFAAAIDAMKDRIAHEAIADVVLHTVVWPPAAEARAQLPDLLAARQPSVKIFTVNADFGAHAGGMLALMDAARDAGIVTVVHCEDAALMKHAATSLRARGMASLRHYADARPVVSEVAATAQVVAFCEETKAPTYIVHLSSARALQACRNPGTTGLPLFVETRPLYLHVTKERYERPDGPLFVGQPPLRAREDQAALWASLADGRIDVLATDHAPWTRAQKMDPSLDIENLRPGCENLQTMLPMYFSEGVRKKRVTLERFVATTATNPAKIFGLHPRKGEIREGALADVAVWDPELTKTVRDEDIHSKAGFSPYAGWVVTGWPTLVIRRGEIVFEGGRVVGTAGSGRLLERQPSA